eukprot:909979-Lingulodinium_polyedra.AAC.1
MLAENTANNARHGTPGPGRQSKGPEKACFKPRAAQTPPRPKRNKARNAARPNYSGRPAPE